MKRSRPLGRPCCRSSLHHPDDLLIAGIDDSKKLSPKKRQSLFEQLTKDHRIYFGVGIVSHEEIDRINILQASIQAMLLAVAQLTNKPTYLLVDGLKSPAPTIPSEKDFAGRSALLQYCCSIYHCKKKRATVSWKRSIRNGQITALIRTKDMAQ